MTGSRRLAFAALAALWLAVAAASVGVVHARHEARKLFVELQTLHQRRDELNVEWNRLRLEQGAWATHARVERLARDKLAMRTPGPDEIVLVTP